MNSTLPDEGIASIAIGQDLTEARAAGFQFTPRWAIGFNAGSKTSDGYLYKRAEHEKKPLALDGLPKSAAIIEKEMRLDFDIKLQDVVFDGDGERPMLITPHGDFALEEGVYDDLCGFLPGRFVAGYTKSLLRRGERDLVAHNINRLLEKADEREKPLKLRTRLSDDGLPRAGYAIVSGDYTAHNADEVARDVAQYIERRGYKGARLDFEYDGERAVWRISWFNYHGAAGAKAAGHGDLFMMGVEISTSDNRSAGVKVRNTAWFNGCLNYIVIDESVVEIGSARHVGRLSLRSRIMDLIDKATTQMKPLADRWEAASVDNVMAEMGTGDPEGTFKALIKRGYGKVEGVAEPLMVARYMAALKAPAPGQNRWDASTVLTKTMVVNAMTQAAHTNRWASSWTPAAIEADAGRLLYVSLSR